MPPNCTDLQPESEQEKDPNDQPGEGTGNILQPCHDIILATGTANVHWQVMIACINGNLRKEEGECEEETMQFQLRMK